MKPTATISQNHSSLLHPIARSAILSASFSTPERTGTDPAGFVSALVHEIRNPLCTINLAIEMLSMMELDEEQKYYLSMIVRGSGRINELVSHLLTLDLAKETGNEV
ncbi:MAG TPA: histidine kinase dimerization/phospho-acceptor domain-containing protein, partial [Puia sp.]|nr:histidine kinase dimerization/phospho-acceptor domain-containing protein [Puia sp.]